MVWDRRSLVAVSEWRDGELLAFVVPAATQGATIEIELAYFSCQPRREAGVYFYLAHKHS